jgi:hypothetical protein
MKTTLMATLVLLAATATADAEPLPLPKVGERSG